MNDLATKNKTESIKQRRWTNALASYCGRLAEANELPVEELTKLGLSTRVIAYLRAGQYPYSLGMDDGIEIMRVLGISIDDLAIQK